MGFFDTVKEQAHELRGRVEHKVDDVQARRKAAHDLEQLGRFLFAERTDRAVAGQTQRDRPDRRRAEGARERRGQDSRRVTRPLAGLLSTQ
jgi:hypothetical protein